MEQFECRCNTKLTHTIYVLDGLRFPAENEVAVAHISRVEATFLENLRKTGSIPTLFT